MITLRLEAALERHHRAALLWIMNYAKHLQNHALARSKLDARVDRHIVQRDDSSFIDVLAYVVFASQSDSWLASAQRDPEWLSNSLLDDPLAGGARDAGNTKLFYGILFLAKRAASQRGSQ